MTSNVGKPWLFFFNRTQIYSFFIIDGGQFPVKQFMSQFGDMITRNYMTQNHHQQHPHQINNVKSVQQHVPTINVAAKPQPPPPSAPTFLYSEVPAVHHHHHHHQQPQPSGSNHRPIFSAIHHPPQNRHHHFTSPSKTNQFHSFGPSAGSNKKLISHFDKSNFRASQPIPLIDGTDMLAPSNFKRFPNKHTPAATFGDDLTHSENKHSYSSSSLRKKRPYHQQHIGSLSFGGDDDEENDWSPAAAATGYPKRYLAAENLQYRQQERISFYPDTNPEYFQPYPLPTKTTTTTTEQPPPTTKLSPKYTFFKAESKYQSGSAGADDSGTANKRNPYVRRKYRTKKPIISTPLPTLSGEIDVNNKGPWAPTTIGYSKDDVKPVVEYDANEEYPATSYSNRDNHAYGSIFVSSTVSSPFEDNNNESSLFITPLGESSSEAASSSTASPTIGDDVDITPKSTIRKNKRVFRRKLIGNLAASATNPDSCESSCLANVVSRDYDPVCGSDNKSYANIGRLRCTKICGDHRKCKFSIFLLVLYIIFYFLDLRIIHFGNCERTSNAVVH